MAVYKEIQCSVACNKLNSKMLPFSWDLNIYRGCQHGCKYCYAVYSHAYLGSARYFEDIYVKTNVVERLEKQLSSPSWKHEVVNIGGVTDSYQPAEAVYKLMPDVLRLLIKYKTPCIISTKSQLILRDYDLIDELSRITYVNIAATITCMDESIRRKIEPNGAPSLKRFDILKEFSKTNASTALHFMPIIPYLTDKYDNINELYANAKDVNVSYVIPDVLNLRGRTRSVFFNFIKKDFLKLYVPLQELYKSGHVSKEYKDTLYEMENKLRAKYGLCGNYLAIMKEKLRQTEPKQISFFD